MSEQNTNTFVQTYDDLYERYTKLENLANHGHPAVRETLNQRYAELQEQFTYALQTRDLGNTSSITDAEKEVQEAEEEIRALEEEVERVRALPLLEHEPASAAEAAADPATQYHKKVAEVYGQLELSRWVFKSLSGRSVVDLRDEKAPAADLKFAREESWLSRRELIDSMLKDASTQGSSSLGLPMPRSLQQEYDLLEDVSEEAESAVAHVAEAVEQRKVRDEQLRQFYTESAKLCRWCREQLANLDTMEEPDHIQEFCGTLIENFPTMSSNFNVLLESVSPYVKANFQPVCRALLEANELWFYLQITTLERLSKILFEIHPTSPLEAEVEKYAYFPSSLFKFLADIRRLIESSPPSAHSNSMLVDCEALEPLSAQFSGLSKEVTDFAERNRISRQGYQCFRDAVLTRLTFIATVDDMVMDSKRRQQDFEETVKELKKWAVDVAHGESWRDIYSKIVEIKRMIKEEQNTLDDLNTDGVA